MRTTLLVWMAVFVAAVAAAGVAFLLLHDAAPPEAAEDGAGLPAEAAPEKAMLVGTAEGEPSMEAVGVDYSRASLATTLGALRFQPPNVPASAAGRLRALVRADASLMKHLARVALGLEELRQGPMPADYPYDARTAANWALAAVPREAAPVLAELLGTFSADARRRRQLLYTLAGFGPDAEAAVPTLLALLDGESVPKVLGEHILFVLGRVGRGAGAATPKLLRYARDLAHPLHGAAIQHLHAVGGMEPDVEALYRALLETRGGTDRGQVFEVVLFQMEKDAACLRPIFVRLLDDENADIRMYAAMSLGQIGVESKVVVQRLGKMAEEESSDTETAALGALRSAGTLGQQELLTVAKRAEYYETAVNALYHLAHTGYPVRDHPQLLLSLLRDAEGGVRANIVRLLATIDPKPRAADFLPFLQAEMRDEDGAMSQEALQIKANLEDP